jgi:hypothetical protein
VNGGDNQLWSFAPTSRGTFVITNKASGKVLDVTGGPSATANGVYLEQWTRIPNETNQEFSVERVGNSQYQIVAANSGRVLTIEGASTADGARLQQWDWLGSTNNNNQRWLLQPVSAVGPGASPTCH